MIIILKWNYKSEEIQSTGYEDILDKLKSYSKEKYTNATEKEKVKIIEDVFEIYRNRNIFPIQYYNNEGIYREINKCIDNNVEIKDNVIECRSLHGISLLRFLFPNLLIVDVRNHKDNNIYSRFYNNHKLKRAIEFSLKYRKSATPSEVRASLEMIEHGIPSNFKPLIAKALYEKYCPKNGIIYDYACGFGGRMLGSLSSKNNYTYIGVEPCIETYTHLNELGLHIEHVTQRENSYKLFCMGSEDYLGKENSIDFAFSSPPYFNLEKYSDEPTQCYNKFPTIEEWFKGYVKPTIKNTYKMLKPNAYYAVNIADFKIGKQEIKFVDKWIEIAEEIGFKYIERIHMQLKSRGGDGQEGNYNKGRKEGIFIFKTIKLNNIK